MMRFPSSSNNGAEALSSTLLDFKFIGERESLIDFKLMDSSSHLQSLSHSTRLPMNSSVFSAFKNALAQAFFGLDLVDLDIFNHHLKNIIVFVSFGFKPKKKCQDHKKIIIIIKSVAFNDCRFFVLNPLLLPNRIDCTTILPTIPDIWKLTITKGKKTLKKQGH